jgi:hypothetical protein
MDVFDVSNDDTDENENQVLSGSKNQLISDKKKKDIRRQKAKLNEVNSVTFIH